ncbi:MAG: TetR/AcrR family transcriptional regulator [Pseudomonadota bacterium]
MPPADSQLKPDPAEVTRQQILLHAKDLFTYFGFNKTNIGDIADRCGMSPGNLYRYYRNKQAIGVAVTETYFRSVEAAMGTPLLLPEGTAEQRIRAFVLAGIKHLADELARNPKVVELAEFICADEEGRKILQFHIDWKHAQLVAELTKGMTSGELARADADEAAGAILCALKAFWLPMTLALWHEPDRVFPDLDAILDLMFRGLRAPA